MNRVGEAIAPARLGRSFRWLLAWTWTANLSDGIAVAAGPLLVESLTDDPLMVGLAWLVARAPWLVFGLHAGVVADRFDRRRIIVVTSVVRVVVLAVLAAAIGGGAVGVGVVLVVLFVLGVAETFADSTATTLLPMLVARRDLGLANARLIFGMVSLNLLVGPPLGAALFVVGALVPFVAQAVLIGFGVVLVSQVVLVATRAAAGPSGAAAPASARRSVRADIRAGVAWLLASPPVRTLALTIFAFNVTFGAAFSVLVVLATDRLGLDELGFGVLTAMTAVGGIVGSSLYGATERRLGMAGIMRIGLVVETSTHLVLATVTVAWPAMVAMLVFGVHASMWATTSTTVRQAAVPEELQGRVGSVYLVGMQGGLVVGAGVGAVLAQTLGITAPYWFAFAGSAAILALIWRELAHIAHAAD